MITLLPRADTFALHPALARDVRGLQKAFDPRRDRGDGADEVDPDDLAWFESFRDDIAAPDLRHAGTMVLGVDAGDVDAYPAALAGALGRLLDDVGADGLIALLAGRGASWISPREHPRVREANAFFRALGAGEGFNGGIVADRDSLADLVTAVFWCARLDAGFGYLYLAARGAPLVATLCQYGNLHLSVWGDGEAEPVAEAARRAGFNEEETCDERFGADGRIEGRQLRMD